MPHLGEKLRAERLQAGLSLADVELAVKVRKRYIEALENEDFAALPGRVYVKGYLRSLAEHYKLDASELLRLFEDACPAPAQVTIVPEVRYISSPSPITGSTVLSVIFLLMLIGGGFYGYQQYTSFTQSDSSASTPPVAAQTGRSPGSATATPRSVVASPTPVPAASSTPTPTSIKEIVIEARAVERSWFEVTVDDNRVFYDFLQSGQKLEWTGKKRIIIRTGNAGGVEIFFNGKSQGLMGPRGQVLTKEWTVPVAGIGVAD